MSGPSRLDRAQAWLGWAVTVVGAVALAAAGLYLFGLTLRVLWGAFRAGLGA